MPALVDARDYERLYRATRTIRPEIRRAFRKRLREAAKIGQKAAREKIRTMPATHRYSAAGAGRHYRKGRPGVGVGLRSTLALNIRVSVGRRDVKIQQFTRGLRGRNARGLPRGIDRGEWEHPTFGHAPKVLQKGHPYFKDTIEGRKEEMLQQVRQVLDDIQAHLDKG